MGGRKWKTEVIGEYGDNKDKAKGTSGVKREVGPRFIAFEDVQALINVIECAVWSWAFAAVASKII